MLRVAKMKMKSGELRKVVSHSERTEYDEADDVSQQFDSTHKMMHCIAI